MYKNIFILSCVVQYMTFAQFSFFSLLFKMIIIFDNYFAIYYFTNIFCDLCSLLRQQKRIIKFNEKIVGQVNYIYIDNKLGLTTRPSSDLEAAIK